MGGKKTVLKWKLMTHAVESTKKNDDNSSLISIIQVPESTERLKKKTFFYAVRWET